MLLSGAIKQVPQTRIFVEQQADIENLRNLMLVRSEQLFILKLIVWYNT